MATLPSLPPRPLLGHCTMLAKMGVLWGVQEGVSPHSFLVFLIMPQTRVLMSKTERNWPGEKSR